MQLSQSAHFVLQCPYVTFGLDDVSNFIESVRVSIAQSGDGPRTRSWSQIIPNSQVIVVPSPPDKPHHWTIKLFLTPSELIVQTLLSLGSLMGLLLCIVAFLHWREKKQDRRDRMREMNRFSF
ncbi:unnamed protein product [Darwinula stevensoni]|uniref:T-cell immunomodulatory protein TIP C2 domain-containing protein n=1 Tax=Darwinula stevensoni TaxID=69355 RepID=A0A7R9AJL6_9CRUS|nr:unnamed protein product [Darwinula stevensoni]CAG0909343.1 unnamed protein product [Darwinula stevensoni]